MRTIILLAFGVIFAGAVQAQVGSSISADGTAPNTNAMLDVQSPSTGDGKGMLIPRVTVNQRTNANASLAGGLLDGSGNLRGGAAQGLIVYQTDGSQGLYFNTNLTATPAWVYLGEETDPRWASASNAIVTDIAGRLSSNVWAAAASTTNYLARTGGTMSGTLNMGAQIVTNATYYGDGGGITNITTTSITESDPRWASASNAIVSNIATRLISNIWAAAASTTNYLARTGGTMSGALNMGGQVVTNVAHIDFNGNDVSVGRGANASSLGAAIGWAANGSLFSAAVGADANGYSSGVALGYLANGSSQGAAVGSWANGSDSGVAVGRSGNGSFCGAAVGREANGAQTNVAIGAYATALSGTERVAIGHYATNWVDNSAVIRGTLYLDGGTGINYRATFGSGAWANKAFTIDHPLDPENKVLRHFCLEGPQVWNVYAGNAQLVNGQAVVQLPDYYSALNLVGSEIYSLTPIGGAFLVGVGQKVQDNRFVIVANENSEVSWTIKVLRNDPACLEDLQYRPVEQLKSELQAGSE